MGAVLAILIATPLAGSVANGIFRSRNARVAGTIATAAAFISFLCAIILFLDVRNSATPVQILYPWISAGTLALNWGFAFDSLTAMMALVITGIGSFIHLYSIGYMSEDETPYRYFAYLNLFLAAMLILVTGDNLPVLFVGWEGVGLCSYLLIGYWYQDLAKSNAGMKAFVVNRIGDAGFLIGMFLCFTLLDSLQFDTMAATIATSNTLNVQMLNWAAFFLFVGAMGKSAQIPLYVWLPDAMAGPTPVSALIHAATMVTAGVYLVARMSFLFQVAPEASAVIAHVGAVTALFAATIAVAQRDIKKVLAYSTVSQLGYMFLGLGVGAYFAGVFHLMTHAFFKALLFLGAGSVIHGLHGEQDIFKMGGLRNKLPKTFLTFTVGVIAIAGIPPLAGFFSKDTILFAALTADWGNPFLWTVGTMASVLTAFYMGRMYFLTFFGDYRGEAHAHESPWVMTLPLLVLAVGSIFAGFLGMPHGLHLLPNYLDNFLGLPAVAENHSFLSEHAAMFVAVLCGLGGLGTAYLLYGKGVERAERLATAFRPLHIILEHKYFVDELYALLFVKPFQWLCSFLARIVDIKVIDASILFPSRLARMGSTALGFVQAGAAQTYLWIMLLGALGVFWFMLKEVLL